MARKGDTWKKKANTSNPGGESGSQQKEIIDTNNMSLSWNDLASVDDLKLYLCKNSTYPVLAEINPVDRCINVSPDWNQYTLMDAASFSYLARSTYMVSKNLNPPDKCRSAQSLTSKEYTYVKKIVNQNKSIDAHWSHSLNSKDSADQRVDKKFTDAYLDIHPNSERCPAKKVLSSQELAPDDAVLPALIKKWQENKTTDNERRNHLKIGKVETRHSALALVYYIAKVPSGREVLSHLGIHEHLTELLEEGNILLLNEVINVLFQLDARSPRIIKSILTAIFNHLGDDNSIPYLQRLLDRVIKDKVVWQHVAAMEMIHTKVLEILKEGKADAVKGFYMETLLRIIRSSKHALLATREFEAEHHEITEIIEKGTPKAKGIAIKLCEVLTDHSTLDEIQRIELQSADPMSSNKLDHTAEPERYGKILDFLQKTESLDEMEVWIERLLKHIEESEAALIATWKREEKFGVITRVKSVGNSKAQNAADKILERLDVVRGDRFLIVYSRRKNLNVCR